VKTVRIPLVGSINTRSVDGEGAVSRDQRFINTLFVPAFNQVTNSLTIYTEKRPAWSEYDVIDTGERCQGLSYFNGTTFGVLVSGFGETNTEVFVSDTSMGSISGRMASISKSIVIGGVEHVFIRSADDTAWYVAYDVYSSFDNTFTGDTHTNTTIDNLAGANSLHVGQEISGSGIQAGTRIQSIDSATQITTTLATTATASGVTITKTPISKIIDADFDSSFTGVGGNFVGLDGYVFTCTPDGKIYNSGLNSADSWGAADYIEADSVGDKAIALAVTKGMLVCFGNNSMEYFRNAGNAANSPLSRIQDGTKNIGLDNSGFALAQLRDDIFFCSSDRWGGREIYRLVGFDLEKISTPQIENIIGTQASDLSTTALYLSAYVLGGQSYVRVVRYSTATNTIERAFEYNLGLKLWAEVTGNIGTFVVGANLSLYINSVYAATRANTGGKVYRMRASSPAYGSDDGETYSLTIQLARQDFGTGNRKFLKSVELVADQTSGTTTLEISKDDGATWETVGTFDMTAVKKIIHRCGSFKGGAQLRLTHSTGSVWRAEALIIEYEVGAH
jgi:hypothetical protein